MHAHKCTQARTCSHRHSHTHKASACTHCFHQKSGRGQGQKPCPDLTMRWHSHRPRWLDLWSPLPSHFRETPHKAPFLFLLPLLNTIKSVPNTWEYGSGADCLPNMSKALGFTPRVNRCPLWIAVKSGLSLRCLLHSLDQSNAWAGQFQALWAEHEKVSWMWGVQGTPQPQGLPE